MVINPRRSSRPKSPGGGGGLWYQKKGGEERFDRYGPRKDISYSPTKKQVVKSNKDPRGFVLQGEEIDIPEDSRPRDPATKPAYFRKDSKKENPLANRKSHMTKKKASRRDWRGGVLSRPRPSSCKRKVFNTAEDGSRGPDCEGSL